MVLAAIQGAG